jgi:hypothetical protein
MGERHIGRLAGTIGARRSGRNRNPSGRHPVDKLICVNISKTDVKRCWYPVCPSAEDNSAWAGGKYATLQSITELPDFRKGLTVGQ